MANQEITTGNSWAVVTSADPTNLDSSYSEWMGWINESNNKIFFLNDNTANNAVWQWMPRMIPATAFTPTIEGSTAAGAGTYTTQSGIYLQIGSFVQVHMTIVWTAHTGTGNMLIGALPSQPNTAIVQIGVPEIQNVALPIGTLGTFAKSRSDTKLDLVGSIAAAVEAPILMSAAGTITLSMSYYV